MRAGSEEGSRASGGGSGGGFGAPPGGYGAPPGGFGAPPGGFGAPPGGYGAPPGGYGAPPGGYGAPPGGGGFVPPPGGFRAPGSPLGAPSSGPWTPTDPISFAWGLVTGRFVEVALPLAVGGFVMSMPGALASYLQSFLMQLGLGTGALGPDSALLVSAVTTPVVMVIGAIAQAYMMTGMFAFCLDVTRGKTPDFGAIFAGGPGFLSLLGATLLVQIGTTIGVFLCIVPGIIFALGMLIHPLVIVDRGLGAIDALKESWGMTHGHKATLFIYALAMFVVFLGGVIACCLGAALISLPMWFLGLTYIYERLSAETRVSA
ncbi:MAG: hypothetical protein OZ921_09485 [Sorangiineae bacterium]|nr:hypothetical protein [Polyangiaceae bacterium]MEB2322735.1 hypothetical protein [Sorangiineae bacterium]